MEAQLAAAVAPSESRGIHDANCAHVGGADAVFFNHSRNSGGATTTTMGCRAEVRGSGYCEIVGRSSEGEENDTSHQEYREYGRAPEHEAGSAAVRGGEHGNVLGNDRCINLHNGATQGVSSDQDHPVDAVTLERRVICVKCLGTGEVPVSDLLEDEGEGGPCKVCAGEKFVEKVEELTVRIPPGAHDGYTAVHPGMGHTNLTGEEKGVR